MARLSLYLFGPFQATLDGQPLTAFDSDKVRALLAYLAVESDRTHRRESLTGMLWPERPEPKPCPWMSGSVGRGPRVWGSIRLRPCSRCSATTIAMDSGAIPAC